MSPGKPSSIQSCKSCHNNTKIWCAYIIYSKKRHVYLQYLTKRRNIFVTYLPHCYTFHKMSVKKPVIMRFSDIFPHSPHTSHLSPPLSNTFLKSFSFFNDGFGQTSIKRTSCYCTSKRTIQGDVT